MADAWDKLVDSAKGVVNSVADVAGEIYGKGRDYVGTKRTEMQLRDNYRLLGKIQYQAESGMDYDEDQKKKVISVIDELIAEIKKSGGSEEKKYEFVACKYCEVMVANDSNYCPNCGKELKEE